MPAAEVVVIGGGHNGLVCACYLARAGLEGLVLEGAHRPRGRIPPLDPPRGGPGRGWRCWCWRPPTAPAAASPPWTCPEGAGAWRSAPTSTAASAAAGSPA